MSFKYSLFLFCFLMSCGGTPTHTVADGSSPVLLSASPVAVSRGSLVTVSGSGFSIIPQENVILLGGLSTAATGYSVTAEGEFVTFRVPDTTPLGEQNIIVIIEGNADAISNQVSLTINP